MDDITRQTTTRAFWANRWWQLVIGMMCMALVANLQYAWTLFVTPMNSRHHWGEASIQLAFAIFILTETWLVPVEGWLVDKFGPRPVVAGGAVCAGIAWVMNSYATTLPMLYVSAVIAGIGAGGVYGTCVGNALKWFPDRRGLAAGLTAAGFGAGAGRGLRRGPPLDRVAGPGAGTPRAAREYRADIPQAPSSGRFVTGRCAVAWAARRP